MHGRALWQVERRLLRLHGAEIGAACQLWLEVSSALSDYSSNAMQRGSTNLELWLEGSRLGPESLLSDGQTLALTTPSRAAAVAAAPAAALVRSPQGRSPQGSPVPAAGGGAASALLQLRQQSPAPAPATPAEVDTSEIDARLERIRAKLAAVRPAFHPPDLPHRSTLALALSPALVRTSSALTARAFAAGGQAARARQRADEGALAYEAGLGRRRSAAPAGGGRSSTHSLIAYRSLTRRRSLAPWVIIRLGPPGVHRLVARSLSPPPANLAQRARQHAGW